MPRLPLTLAINPYDHVRDLLDGSVAPEGIALTCLTFSVEEIFYRFSKFREWDVSELSLAKYCSMRAAGDDSLIAIPVFPSRIFRHSAIFVRGDGEVRRPEQLAGRRIGIPEWTQTATVYARGLLEHEYGVALTDVEWVQAGVNEPGRVEGIAMSVPEGVRYRSVPDRSLTDLLLAGEIDAIISAHPPTEFKLQTGSVIRLFDDYPAVEREYYERTGVFPIMHVIAIQREVYDEHPWVAMNLFMAFEEAKRRSYERVLSPTAPFFPIPWGFRHAERARDVFGADFWPYGIEPNRPTLEAFLQFALEQGVTTRELHIDEAFAVETSSMFRI
jgi:4,5-dihydroxyphthalate decarboxylase